MNPYFSLFWNFLQIGAFSFGGGYGMLSVIREKCLSNGWLTQEELMNFIAVAESTPGPIAVNMATFVGSSQGGILGALLATLGVVLPSFLIILGIVALMQNVMNNKGVLGALNGVKPVVVGLITATGITILGPLLFDIAKANKAVAVDGYAIFILCFIFLFDLFYRKWRKKKASPILLILISALFGMVFYGS